MRLTFTKPMSKRFGEEMVDKPVRVFLGNRWRVFATLLGWLSTTWAVVSTFGILAR